MSGGPLFGANENVIRCDLATSIVDGSSVTVKAVRFTPDRGTLGSLRFLKYFDETSTPRWRGVIRHHSSAAAAG
jgi:hypothetical protein